MLWLVGEMFEFVGIYGWDLVQMLWDGIVMDWFCWLVVVQGGDLLKLLLIGLYLEIVMVGVSGIMGDIDVMVVGLVVW